MLLAFFVFSAFNEILTYIFIKDTFSEMVLGICQLKILCEFWMNRFEISFICITYIVEILN